MTHSTASYTRQSHYHKSIGKQLMQDSPFHLNSESILRRTTIFQHSKKKRPRNQFTKYKLCMGKSPGERHFCFHMHNISLSWTAHSSSQCRQIHTINHTHTIYIPNLACSCLKSVPAWLTPASEKWHQHHNNILSALYRSKKKLSKDMVCLDLVTKQLRLVSLSQNVLKEPLRSNID